MPFWQRFCLCIKSREKTVKADPNNGRPGMTRWQILVLGVLGLGLNADYDRILELANEHKTLRKMLGHSDWAAEKLYDLQTLKDNLRLFTPPKKKANSSEKSRR